jgi:hypothetical protein
MKKMAVLLIAVVFLGACGSSPVVKPSKASEEKRPAWVDKPIHFVGENLIWVGVSQESPNEILAKTSANMDAASQLLNYLSTLIDNKEHELLADNNSSPSSQEISQNHIATSSAERASASKLEGLTPNLAYWEYYDGDSNNRGYYLWYVQMQSARPDVEKMLNAAGKIEAAKLKIKAAAEQDNQRKQQLEKAAEFFNGNLSSLLDSRQ